MLVQRGFARIKVGNRVVDLADAGGQPAALPAPGDGEPLSVVLDRVVIGPEARRRLTDSLEAALAEGQGTAAVEIVGGPVIGASREFRCPACGVALTRPRPLLFSFNHPLGACPECKGFGNILRYDEALVVPDRSRSLAEQPCQEANTMHHRHFLDLSSDRSILGRVDGCRKALSTNRGNGFKNQ
jgi:excinuclease ABC subunit A